MELFPNVSISDVAEDGSAPAKSTRAERSPVTAEVVTELGWAVLMRSTVRAKSFCHPYL